jgi:hydroxypyruvate reductase
LRAEAELLFRAAIDAVQPSRLVRDTLKRDDGAAWIRAPGLTPLRLTLPLLVVGAGKAAAAMALGCEAALGADNVTGEVIAPDGADAPLASIHVHRAGHPLPDMRGVTATRSILRQIRDARTFPVVCLISGGASSLLVSPRPPITLEEKIETNRLLLECGADIFELNTVRKHLSEVKGGGLLRQTKGVVVTLLISDVVGDDPATIGSGPSVPDPTTYDDAWRIITKYDLEGRLPAAIINLIQAGRDGDVEETVKPASEVARRGAHASIGSNLAALQGAAATAQGRGWDVYVHPKPLVGDTRQVAMWFTEDIKRRRHGKKLCVVAGGETTVHVRGRGRGGRNQEFALAMAEGLAGEAVVVLSAGTDGIDGPTAAAGAFVDGQTLARAKGRGLSISSALADNDSNTFFRQLGDLFVCGATGTNVMDIKIALFTD